MHACIVNGKARWIKFQKLRKEVLISLQKKLNMNLRDIDQMVHEPPAIWSHLKSALLKVDRGLYYCKNMLCKERLTGNED